jgi:hypothetical protein
MILISVDWSYVFINVAAGKRAGGVINGKKMAQNLSDRFDSGQAQWKIPLPDRAVSVALRIRYW